MVLEYQWLSTELLIVLSAHNRAVLQAVKVEYHIDVSKRSINKEPTLTVCVQRDMQEACRRMQELYLGQSRS